MFEGVVSQVLAGYLGRYVKGIQKDQLKIGIWNEEVLLENVELILEAFDYLQLPVALKNGRVGKLSIKIPWKKLGWDPIIVVLEDVFICSCQREDNEWSFDSVGRRELAGKMAKLNAVELAKFSRRVSDNKPGQSFISYISAKILDNIQVSIRNVHIVYMDSQNDQGKFIFGLRFSSLTIMTDTPKSSSTISSSGKFQSGQVNKIVEISAVELYCNLFEENHNLLAVDNTGDLRYCFNTKLENDVDDFIVHPFDVTLHLVANKSGGLEGAPQYAVTTELPSLIVSLNDIQLHQLLSFADYLSISALREKYGRYRPSQNSLAMKVKGWQKMWWHYAQESVLVDVRRKLRKTSWGYFGKRISERRKYVNLYKRKLELLQQEQLVSKDILHDLEKMDKECDIDDILAYRSTAEQLQELLVNSKSLITRTTSDSTFFLEKQQNGERSSGGRGWLNWLSLGMLGAGGTADSSSFAGVVSDEIIKDIHEATSFHPVFSEEDISTRDKFFSPSFKLTICQIIISVSSRRCKRKIAYVTVGGVSTECKYLEDSIAIIASMDTVKIMNPCNENAIFVAEKAMLGESSLLHSLPFINVRINIPQLYQSSEVSVKVALQSFEATYESDFLEELLYIYEVFASYQFQHNRVMSSLNGLEDFKARLLSKVEYISSNRKRLNWDVNLNNAIIKLTSLNKHSENLIMVLELEALSLRACPKTEGCPLVLDCGNQCNLTYTACLTDWTNTVAPTFQHHDLYDHFEIGITGLRADLILSDLTGAIPFVEKFNASITFGLCIFLDEKLLKQFEIVYSGSTIRIHFSSAIFNAFWSYSKQPDRKSEALMARHMKKTEYYKGDDPCPIQFSLCVKLEQLKFLVDIEDDIENGSDISFIFEDIDVRYTQLDYIQMGLFVKMLKIDCYNLNNDSGSYSLCSLRSSCGINLPNVGVEYVVLNLPGDTCGEISSAEGCLQLHYQARSDGFVTHHDISLGLSDINLHVHPKIIGLLQKFFKKLDMHSSSSANSIAKTIKVNGKVGDNPTACLERPCFGFSNFLDTELTASTGIPVDRFPFVTIQNSGTLSSLDDSLIVDVSNLENLYVKDQHFPRRRESNIRKWFRNANHPSVKSDDCHTQNVLGRSTSNNIIIGVILNGVQADFHDSSCILGTIGLPSSKISLSFPDNDHWDALFSVDGLVLTSSYSRPNVNEFLWGPSSPSVSPVLNIRVTKDSQRALSPLIEISFSIQHVCCTLSSEFLAIIIGYFCLPDWTSVGNKNFNPDNDVLDDSQDTHNKFIYKIEILDSTLILPVEGHNEYCLQLELPQLYCSFTPQGNFGDDVKDIAVECRIPADNISDRHNIINVFGRRISLLLVMLSDDIHFLLKLDNYTLTRKIPFVVQLDADLWIRVPCETTYSFKQSAVHTLVMMKTHVCNLVAEDEYFYVLEAAEIVIDRLCSVGIESKKFESDILQFLQLRKSSEGVTDVSAGIVNESYVRMKFFVDVISIKFMSTRIDDTTSKLIAEADVQLNLSGLLRNGILQLLDMDISRLIIHSFNGYLLATFVSDRTLSSHLSLNYSISDRGETEVLLAVPSFDIWLHLSDWNSIIELLCSDKRQPEPATSSSCVNPHHNVPGSLAATSSEGNYVIQETVTLILNSENITMSLHLPISNKEDDSTKTELDEIENWNSLGLPSQMSNNPMLPSESKHCKYINFIFQSKYCKVTVYNSSVRLKCHIDRMRVQLEIIHNRTVSSIPCAHISLIKVETELSRNCGGLFDVLSEVDVESFDVGLSHQVFNFWSCSQLKVSQTGSSQNLCHSMVFNVNLKKSSLLLSDGRWSYHGPILEIFMKNMLLESKQTEDVIELSASTELLVNYNNIDKVMWEPFIEPWSFQLNVVRKPVGIVRMTTSAKTDVVLKSLQQLNLNITESLVEGIFRLHNMLEDAFTENRADRFQENQEVFRFQTTDDVHTRRYAPYILQNDTSLPLNFRVSRGSISADDTDPFLVQDGNILKPGCSAPIYVEETLDEQYLRHRTGRSSERLLEKKLGAVAHHMISVQLDGTSEPSQPMSMDLVGVSYFEVNFSKNKSTVVEIDQNDCGASGSRRKMEERFRADKNNGLVVPVVFEVSMQNYSKLIRLYSTVILFNATSMPLEIRFDIPFGVSPKILDPVLPGQEIPLPLHLAETGRVRWRPLGSDYLWSEAHSLSDMLSQVNKIGFFRSFVCYPSNPNSDPFRCCISVQDHNISSICCKGKYMSLNHHRTERVSVNSISQRLFNQNSTKKHFIRQLRLTTPLLVKNCLPVGLSLKIDSGGVAHSFSLSEANTSFVFLVDSAHDLGITFHVEGFRPIIAKFPRAESFSNMAKLTSSKYSLSETLNFYHETTGGPVCITIEKAMDSLCGAREICLFVPFLLYNCTGLLLTILHNNDESKGSSHDIPSCYDMIGHKDLSARKHGLPLLLSKNESFPGTLDVNGSVNSPSKDHIFSNRDNSYFRGFSQHRSVNEAISSLPLCSTGNAGNGADYVQNGGVRKVKAYMYGPVGHSTSTDLIVKLSGFLPQGGAGNTLSTSWSSPFSLAPESGSTSVVIPQPCSSGAFLLSATSIPVAGELSGRTRAISFQPRYIICNACDKDLSYKQKGTSFVHHLSIGQHSDLHWSDTTRELLVSIRFNESGWQWSGSFLPDYLGDAQVKMRNYVSGESYMVRVEVQNADFALNNEKTIRSPNGSSMTQLILLSDDKTGFMPYRIDNFSMERLRIYQQRGEVFETIVHSYTSCKYAWDEPCYPHRLIVEVPGERVVGTYALDDVKEYGPVFLPSTSEKPERKLCVSIHAEGAIKVLNIIDSSYHVVKDTKEANLLGNNENKEVDRIQDYQANFSQMITFQLAFIGISLINSSPQELIYARAEEATVVIIQSLDQQKISFQISSLQIDNQVPDTLYPIMLSFNNEHRRKSRNIVKDKDNNLRSGNESTSSSMSGDTSEPIFHFAATKWRNTDTSLMSFKEIILGFAPMCIELEEQVFLGLFEFYRTTSSRLLSRASQKILDLWTPHCAADVPKDYFGIPNINRFKQYKMFNISETQKNNQLLPRVVPIGAPWQQIYLLAKKQRKIYVELLELAPINLSLSFSSTPWIIRSDVQGELNALNYINSTILPRGLMALVNVEGVPVHLGQLMMEHLMASQKSIQEILIRHYTRQMLHEMYKIFGSAGVIGNPMGFARNFGLGIKDFLSVSRKGILQSPSGLLTGIAKGSQGLINNTVYAVSSATTQFSKAAHKGIVAFTFDEQTVSEMDVMHKTHSHGKGVLDGVLEGLTGLLQSPIRGAEKHGLPGVLSGIAIGTAGLIARPMASILEATGKTAQSIRNRSSPHQSHRFRIRFPRPLARELPLLPYSWEEAIGVSVLLQADSSRLKDETFVMCKALKHVGRYVVITERLVLDVSASCLVDFGKPEFAGVPADPGWAIEIEMSLESVIHNDRAQDVVNVVGSNAETPSRHKRGSMRNRPWKPPLSTALFHMSLQLPNVEEAEDVLQVLSSTIEQGKERRWGAHVMHRSNFRL